MSSELKSSLASINIVSALDLVRSLYETLNPNSGDCEVCSDQCVFLSFKLGFKKFFGRYCKMCMKSSPERIASFKDAGKKRVGNLKAWSDEARNQRIATNQLRYGGDNVMSSDDIKKKIKVTLNDRYGSCSSFIATEEGKKNWLRGTLKAKTTEVKKKQADTNFKKYGVISKLVDPKVKEDLIISRGNRVQDRVKQKAPHLNLLEPYRGCNELHRWKCLNCSSEFVDTVDDGSLPWCITCNGPNTQQGELHRFIKSLSSNLDVRYNTRTVISPKELDLYLPEKKIAIEYNGVYWHANQLDKNLHLSKTLACKKAGIQLFHIFEDEWILKSDIWKSMLKIKLGFADERIFARKCIVRPINGNEAKQFLDRCHLRSSVPSKLCYGLYHLEELVGVATFGKPRYSKTADLELLRIAFKLGSHVIGGVGKLINYAIKELNPSVLLTYVDRTLGEGTAYAHLGFEQIDSTAPGYFYINGYKRFHRTSFQKHKLQKLLPLFDANLSERENMKLNGYSVIYDCGTNIFHKKMNNDRRSEDRASHADRRKEWLQLTD